MKSIVLIPSACVLLFFSCKKKEEIQNEHKLVNRPAVIRLPKSTNYTHFKKGTYWIYHHYKVENNGTETLLNHIQDSVFVSGIKTIGDTAYIVNKSIEPATTVLPEEHLVEIDNVIYDNYGQAVFSVMSVGDTLSTINQQVNNKPDGIVSYRVMKDPGLTISVPAGDFDVLEVETTSILNFDDHFKDTPAVFHKYYAKQVGVVMNTYFYLVQLGESHFERRLVRYHIEK